MFNPLPHGLLNIGEKKFQWISYLYYDQEIWELSFYCIKFSHLREKKYFAARHHHAELSKLSTMVICVPPTHCKTC